MNCTKPPRSRMLLASLLMVQQVTFGLPSLGLGAAEAKSYVGPKPKVWVASLKVDNAPGAGLVSEKFDEAAREDLSKNRHVKLAGTGAGPVKVVAGGDDPRVAEAENYRTAGKDLFSAGQHEQALVNFKQALKLYEAGLASVSRVDALTETLGYLGATSLLLKYDGDARDYFRQVIGMVPEAEPLDEFPQQVKDFFNKEKKKRLKKKRGVLKITTTPPGALIRVDGEEKGKSPLTVKGLVRGFHYVQASDEAAGAAALKVKVKSRKPTSAELKLSMDLGPPADQKVDPALEAELKALAAKGVLDDDFKAKARKAAKATSSQYVVVGNIATQGAGFVMSTFVYGVKEQQVVALDELKFRANMSSAFIQAVAFSKAVEAAVNQFPFDKVVVGGIVAPKPVSPPPPIDPPVAKTPVAKTPVAKAPVAKAPVAKAPVAKAPVKAPPREVPAADPPPPEDPIAVKAIPEPEPVSALDEPPPPPGKRGEDDDDAWYGSWWFWTVTGVVVVGGAVTAGYLLSSEDEESTEFNASVRW